MKKPTFIDLFCGCGGFSLGMEKAGFNCLAAVDFNHEAITVFERNFAHVPQILEKDLTKFPPAELAKLISQPSTNNSQSPQVDVIVGGPPCQGFSAVRQVDGANNGKRMVQDDRRHLYREFLRYVEFFQPKVFVMENVLGIRSASGGEYFTRVQKEGRELGYCVHAQVEDCVELGLPQKRRRQLFIGTRLDLFDYFRPVLKPASRACAHPPLWEAIGDLPPVEAGQGDESCDYDMERRKMHIERFGRRYLYSVLEIKRAAKLTAHRAGPHNERDLRDFLLLKEGESSAAAMRDRGIEFEFPIARTHQFRVIGNAVPPLVGEAVGNPALN